MSEHAHYGRERCSNCRVWRDANTLPITVTMPKPAGGDRIRKFCDEACAFGWALKHGAVPLELLPAPVLQHLAQVARHHQANKVTRQGDPTRHRRRTACASRT